MAVLNDYDIMKLCDQYKVTKGQGISLIEKKNSATIVRGLDKVVDK
jgi:hypothetical protein